MISAVFKAFACISITFVDSSPPSFMDGETETLRTRVDKCRVPRLHFFTKPQTDEDYQAIAQRRPLKPRGLGTRVAGTQGQSSELGRVLKTAMWGDEACLRLGGRASDYDLRGFRETTTGTESYRKKK